MSQVLTDLVKRMVSEKKRGAQPGNRNAIKHGRFSAPLRAARRAANLAAWEENQRRSDEWMNPQTDYGAIVEGIRTLRLRVTAGQ
jgi:hypothetical protein